MTSAADAAAVVLDGELLERFKRTAKGDGPQLTADEREQLSRVTHIGHDFLADCDDITQLDLSPLSKITSVDNGFLTRCGGLTALDLSALRNVTRNLNLEKIKSS